VVASLAARRCDQPASQIKSDEEVVFFATFGHFLPESASWALQVHGWIFEPEEESVLRAAGLERLRLFLGLDADAAASVIFNERGRAFLVDNERGKEICIRLGDAYHTVGVSEANGHFAGTLHLSREEVATLREAQAGDDGWLTFRAVTREDDRRVFAGRVQLIEPSGYSVISDIDDTIKVSQVSDRQALLLNTFCRRFQPVPGMAEVYSDWAEAAVRFHYVSASTWQLYKPLRTFLRLEGFPEGSFHLKSFRLKDSTVLDLVTSPEVLKLAHIEPILAAFPGRRFLLVGDSGEKDPEVYGTLARDYPEQVVRILIRDVSGGEIDSGRFERAFQGVPRSRWMVFRGAAEIDISLASGPSHRD
jgi:hypothetical protein